MGDFNITLGNKYRSIGSKGRESQEEFMSLITEFDLEELWRHKTQTAAYIRTFMARVILTPVLMGLTQVLT